LVLLATVSCTKKQFACMDVTGLSADEAQARMTLAYTDSSTDPKKTCATCQQFVEGVPARGASSPPWLEAKEGCGTCKLLKGPIHPNGNCKSFALKA
jgi:hypothetical protein